MLTTTVAGRTWNFEKAIGRNAAAGNGFTQPYALAIDSDDVVFVLSRGSEAGGTIDSPNKRVGKVTLDEELIGEFARGDVIWGAGVAVAKDGTSFVSDEYQNKIFVYDEDGILLRSFGETGSAEGQLNGPSGLAVDSDGNLLVVDSKNNRIQKFTREGRFQSSFGEQGTGPGQFNQPWGITIDKNDDIYVADWGNNRVQKFTRGGTHIRDFGNAEYDDGGLLRRPSSVAVDSQGDVYVVNWGDKNLKIYTSEGESLTTLYGDALEFSKWAKEVVESNPDVVKAYRRVKDITPLARFERPTAVVVDSQDRVIVSESTRGRLQIYAKEKNYMDPQFNL
jgi:DNA-binding beta-propeller fold protein YncE